MSTKTVNLRLSKDICEVIKKLADDDDRSFNYMVEKILREYFVFRKDKKTQLEIIKKAFDTFRYVPFPHNNPTWEEWIENEIKEESK